MAKIVISCAITGSIHTPTMSDALPITPDQIATQAIDAAAAGAAILHLHARDPKDGRPSPDASVFMQFLPRIKQATDAVVNITTGGAVTMTVEQRISAANTLSPEMCSMNMGSMNFALYPMAKRYKNWKYDWEESYLTNSDAYIFPNTFRDIEKVYKTLGEGHGVKFEHECYDTGHLYNLAHLIDRGLFKPPVFVQLIFGILGGIGADLDNLFFMKRTADRLFGKDYLWSVLAGGRHQMNFCTAAAMMGGNVRVGLEDSLYIGPGKLASSNAEQVTKIRRIVEDLGHQIATPAEARQMLASGAAVALWDIGAAALGKAAASLAKSGRVYTAILDLTAEAEICKAVEALIRDAGKIDIVVNNAGITGGNAPLCELKPDVWRRVIEVNLVAPYLVCRAVVPHMTAAGYGRIVNIASIAGKEGNPNASHYSASKAGLIGLTKSLAKELATTGVLVNAITPAAAKTEMFGQMTQAHIDYMLSKIPMNRFVNVEELAAMIAWLASEDCSFSTGAVFDISGGRATY